MFHSSPPPIKGNEKPPTVRFELPSHPDKPTIALAVEAVSTTAAAGRRRVAERLTAGVGSDDAGFIISRMPNAATPAERIIRSLRDVLLVPTVEVEDRERDQHPPAGDPPVELGREVRLTRHLAGVNAERIVDACEPRGENFKPFRQFGCRYTFVRELAAEQYTSTYAQWDNDQTLLAAFTLSRLILDNAYSTEYAARVVEFSDDHVQIILGPVNLEGSLAYRARPGRDWLDGHEAPRLAKLLDQFWRNRDGFSPRLANAIWLTEQSSRRKYEYEALITIMSGLEALTNTGPRHNTKQFVQRVPDLANEIGVRGLSRTMARRLHEHRSEPAHGRRLALIPGPRPSEPAPNHTQREAQAMRD